MKLTDKEIIELKLKCLEPFIITSSKHGLTKGDAISAAREAWKFATETIGGSDPSTKTAVRPSGSGGSQPQS